MPIVRFSRDKRGLDTIYLIDTASEGGRRTGGARVLYFWTAPPGLRVGRSALDDSAQRALQRAHPDIPFDWPALLKAVEAAGAQAAALSADPRREAWRGAGRTTRAAHRQTSRDDAPPLTVSSTAPPADPELPSVSSAEVSSGRSEGRRGSSDPRPAEAPDPAGDGPPASEDDAGAGRRPRRRRRRSKRAAAGDETPAAADPIIDS